MKTFLIILVVVIVFGGIYYFAKSGYKTNSTSTSTTSPSANSVSIANFSFSPMTLTVKVDQEITFTNNDSVTHTVTFADFNSGNLTPGQSFKHTFSTAGTFDYHCSIHPSMTGTIIVQ